MSKLSLVALLGIIYASPAEALLTEDDLMHPRYAVGKCEYKGYVLEFECDRERKSVDKCVLKNAYLHGEKAPFPDFPMPKVVVRYPEILSCIDPPEKKKEEKKPFLCC